MGIIFSRQLSEIQEYGRKTHEDLRKFNEIQQDLGVVTEDDKKMWEDMRKVKEEDVGKLNKILNQQDLRKVTEDGRKMQEDMSKITEDAEIDVEIWAGSYIAIIMGEFIWNLLKKNPDKLGIVLLSSQLMSHS